MNKKVWIIIGVIIVAVAAVAGVYFLTNQGSTNDLSALTGAELTEMIEEVYEKAGVELPRLETSEVDLTNTDMLSYNLGVSSAEGIKAAVISQPLMTSQAFTFALIQTEEGANIEALKKSILDGVNPRKWICVGVEKVQVTNSDSVICLIMADAESCPLLANAFAEITGNKLGNTLEKNGDM